MLFLVCGFVLLSCTRDLESHLVSLGLETKRGATGLKPEGDSHMKQTGMLVVSLKGVNFGF